MRNAPTIATPIPMPAFAPVERPLLLLGTEVGPLNVGRGVAVAAACVTGLEEG